MIFSSVVSAVLALSRRLAVVGAIAAGIAAVAIVLGTPWLAEAKRARGTPKGPAAAEECKLDVDCALVPDDCCACSEGGAQRAIPKKRRDEYEKQRLKRCAGTMCAQMISQHQSCSQLAFCGGGVCKLGDVPSATSP